MLELDAISWSNFMSYGDYHSEVNLSTLGQCLITGEVTGDEKSVFADSNITDIKKSNGAGKSTIPNVILWTLFGRTMHVHNPGDKVLNWFTGKDCKCKLTFKNGDHITRTRNTNGMNELIFVRDGDEHTLISDTLSTTKVQQTELNRVFGLDWDIFCGSMFFNQYSKPWMEMADGTRKKAIERVLHVDRFTYYAKTSKEKCDKIDTDVQQKRNNISTAETEITRLGTEIIRLTESSSGFIAKQRERQAQALRDAVDEKKQRDLIDRPDLEQLKKKWEVVVKVEKRINDMEKEVTILNRNIASLEGVESNLKQRIKTWEVKAGKICGVCEQDVPKAHTESKIEPIRTELTNTHTELNQKLKDLKTKTNTIEQTKTILHEKSPGQTITIAEETHKKWNYRDKEIKRLKQLAKDIAEEENPHEKSIEATNTIIEKHKKSLEKLKEDIERVELLNQHYYYIYKAWNDRTKIKSFVFQDHIPYINSRLKYYLDVFGLDVQIELTPALGITSNMWGYEFESGGERKRTDVAFMFAMFDFHEEMYGRQCNILVLDEVDGRLDDDGIDSLIGIIKNDLASKVESIMVISHRNMMHDVFENELLVKRTGTDNFRGFSQLDFSTHARHVA